MQIIPSINSEFEPLKTVVVGVARKMGGPLELDHCYDARSYESVENGIFPDEVACMNQVAGLISALENSGVQVLRPSVLEGVNQVFARDIAFAIDDQLILPNIIEDRAAETTAVESIVSCVPSSNIIMLPNDCFAEGGDVLVLKNHVFVGVSDDLTFETYKTARTNYAGFEYLQDEFPLKEFKAFELLKHDTDPRLGCLHLDCALQPIGLGAIIAPKCFKHEEDVAYLFDFFGRENIYDANPSEAYDLVTNVFSISPTKIVVAAHLVGLISWLKERGVEVIEVQYDQIVKMGGLLRCSTMPLVRASND
jgi:N-dimethylarginine dimethylaminohydrolase